VYELVAQRVYGLALGYDDLNDHDQLLVDLFLKAHRKPPKQIVNGAGLRRIKEIKITLPRVAG
jgi:hypothetical protein